MRKLFSLLTLLLTCASSLYATCTATKQNADFSSDTSANSVTLTSHISAVGDLVVFSVWCYGSSGGCTPGTVTLGSQTATQTTVSGIPGPGSPGEGQAFLYYITSAATSGTPTITANVSGSHTDLQVAYEDFSASAGCTFSHDQDSPLGKCQSSCGGSGTGTISQPAITPTAAGEVLVVFTWTSEHVNNYNSPWTCPNNITNSTCEYDPTKNAMAYILSSSSGSTANNANDIHASDTWQALITSFSMSQTYYICAVTGSPCNASDSNAGTSKTATWLHSPGMKNCSANCASHTITPGDAYIFRGGDTWHFGNSSATPYAGVVTNCAINNTFSGGLCLAGINKNASSGPYIYYGVDQTWFSGGSYTRPIFTADNPLTPNPGVFGDYVGSCLYQVGTQNVLVWTETTKYIQLDGFELTGLCQQTANAPGDVDTYIDTKSDANNIYSNLYIHGWTHLRFSASGSPCTGMCFNLTAFRGATSGGIGTLFTRDVVDGSDSDPSGLQFMFATGYSVIQNVFRYTAQGLPGPLHDWHENLLEHWYCPGDNNAHPNFIESEGDATGTNAVYNNVLRNIATDSGSCPIGSMVGLWFLPPVGSTTYEFNNVLYNTPSTNILEYINISNHSNNTGTQIYFNNTLEDSQTSTMFGACFGATNPYTAANNHYIYDQANPYDSSCSSQQTTITNKLMTHSSATSNGYTAGQTYAYSPTSSGSPTVGFGTNFFGTYCATLTSSGPPGSGTACGFDTTYGVGYNATTHSVIYPVRTAVGRPVSAAWDVGAYQYSGGSSSPAPVFTPSSVAFGNQPILQVSPPISVTLQNTGTGNYVVSQWSLNNNYYSIQANTCGTPTSFSFGTSGNAFTLTPGASCTFQVLYYPNLIGQANAGSVVFLDNTGGGSTTLVFSGTGAPPPASATPMFAGSAMESGSTKPAGN